MIQQTDSIDQDISRKLQELKDLLFLRYALTGLEDDERQQLADTPTPKPAAVVQIKTSAPAKAQPALIAKDVPDRVKRIEAAAKRITMARPGRRRRYTSDQKLEILEEYERAQVKKDVIDKYGLHASSISNWRKAMRAGKLVPLALAQSYEDEGREDHADPFDEGEPQPVSFPEIR